MKEEKYEFYEALGDKEQAIEKREQDLWPDAKFFTGENDRPPAEVGANEVVSPIAEPMIQSTLKSVWNIFNDEGKFTGEQPLDEKKEPISSDENKKSSKNPFDVFEETIKKGKEMPKKATTPKRYIYDSSTAKATTIRTDSKGATILQEALKDKTKISGATLGTTNTYIGGVDPISDGSGIQWLDKINSIPKAPIRWYYMSDGRVVDEEEAVYLSAINKAGVVREVPNPTDKKQEKIPLNKSEEIYLNYNELADELAVEELKAKHGEYNEVGMIDEWTELCNKYKNIILKHERNEG